MSSLGGITSLPVNDWSGFDFPEVAAVTPILGNNTGTYLNALIQGSSLGFAMSAISGTITSSSDLALLKGYAEAKSTQTFTDPESNTYSVVVMNLKTHRLLGQSAAWTYSCNLHKVA